MRFCSGAQDDGGWGRPGSVRGLHGAACVGAEGQGGRAGVVVGSAHGLWSLTLTKYTPVLTFMCRCMSACKEEGYQQGLNCFIWHE